MLRGFLALLLGAKLFACSQIDRPVAAERTELNFGPEVSAPRDSGIVAAPRSQGNAAVVSIDGGWLVVWEDNRHAMFRGTDIYGARVLFDGGVLDPYGVPLVTGPTNDINPEISWNGESFILAWNERPRGFLWASFVSSSLTPSPPIQLGGTQGNPRNKPRLALVGDSTVVGWEQVELRWAQLFRDGGTSANTNQILSGFETARGFDFEPFGDGFITSFHAYNAVNVQFVNLDAGVLPNGVDGGGFYLNLTTNPDNALYNRVIDLHTLRDGRVAAAWARSNASSWVTGLHFATIELDGGGPRETVLRSNMENPSIDVSQVKLGDDGTRIVECASAEFYFGTAFAYLVTQPFDGGSPNQFYITSDAGQPLRDCVVGSSNQGVALVAYRNQQGEQEPSIRFQLHDSASNGPKPERLLSGSPPLQEHPSVAFGGLGSTPWLWVWSDARNAATGFDTWAQRFDTSTQPPVVTSSSSGDEVAPQVVALRDGGYALVFSDGDLHDSVFNDGDLNTLRVQLLNNLGTNPRTLTLTGRSPRYELPALTTIGDSLVIVAASQNPRVVDAWTVIPNDGGLILTPLTSGPQSASRYALAPFEGELFMTWDNGFDVFGNTLTATDAGQWAQGPQLTLTSSPQTETRPAMAGAPNLQLFWEDTRSGQPRLWSRSIEVGGALGVEYEVSSQPGAQRQPFALTLADGGVLVAWEQENDAGGVDVFAKMTSSPDAGIPTGVLWAGDGGRAQNLRPALATNGPVAVLVWNRLEADGVTLVAQRRFVTFGAGQGESCGLNGCADGYCVDGVCCESPCGGGVLDCQACSIDAGASQNGRCEILPTTFVCRPVQFPECDDAPEQCIDLGPDCPADTPINEGGMCGADGGMCMAGACVVPMPPMGGGGGTGGGAGGGDAAGGGATGGGGGSANGGGSATGGGDQDAGAGPFSHYAWNQGCGCSGTSMGALVPLIGALFLVRRRRIARAGAVVIAALLLGPMSARAADAPAKPRLAFNGLQSTAGISSSEVEVLSDYLHTKLVALGTYEVIGVKDVQELLGMERQRALLGCGESSCVSELAGALNAGRILRGDVSRLGETLVINLSLLDARANAPLHRTGQRVKASTADAAFDILDKLLMDLLEKDPLVAAKLPSSAQPARDQPTREWSFGVGARVDADFIGLADGAAAVLPGVTVQFQYAYFGAAATLLLGPTIGVRAEARFLPLPRTMIRPWIGAGAVIFGPAVGLRGALGLGAQLGPVMLFLDGGVEGFVSGDAVKFRPLAVVAGLGIAWTF